MNLTREQSVTNLQTARQIPLEITEKWLGEIGGWQAMKAARELVRLGAVSEARREGNTIIGLAGQSRRPYRAIMKLGGPMKVDCQCACPEGQRGLICAHALAVALVVIQEKPVSMVAAPISDSKSINNYRHIIDDKQITSLLPVKNGKFTIFVGFDQIGRLQQGGLPIFLQFESGSETVETDIGHWLQGRKLEMQTQGLRLAANELESFLIAITEHPRVHNGLSQSKSLGRMEVADHLRIPLVSVALNPRDDLARIALVEVKRNAVSTIKLESRWIWNAGAALLCRMSPGLQLEVQSFAEVLLQKGVVEVSLPWLATHQSDLRELLTLDERAERELGRIRLLPVQPELVLLLDGNLRRLRAKLSVRVGEEEYPAGMQLKKSIYPTRDKKDALLFYSRNLIQEQAHLALLQSAGFSESANGWLELAGENEILRLHSAQLPRWRQRFQIVESDAWRAACRGLVAIRPRLHSREGTDKNTGDGTAAGGMEWLSLDVAYEAPDGFRIPRSEVLRLIRSGRRDMKGRDGKRYVLDVEGCEELEESLQDVSSRFVEGGQSFRIPSRQAEALADFAADPAALVRQECAALPMDELRVKLGSLGAMLREYQLAGVQWLERLQRQREGGLLADEMGLGKTVQTLALLSEVWTSTPVAERRPALVVCPTSLLTNWAEEAQRFAPQLKTHISHDTGRRQHLDDLGKFDVIITSYALISRDLAHFQKVTFSVIVLDEASYIRNPDTETAKAVRQLRADARFALTGTPVENSAKDLWSVFQFMMPSYLPDRDAFHERFVKPLQQPDSLQSKLVMARLRRLVKPYLLRRTKREVAKDLPEKIEKIVYCDLTGPQREIYQRLLDEGREEIRQARRKQGQGSARMTMFTVLLRLRQICNDVRLLKSGVKTDEPSGKWPVLEETFQELVEGGHKTLVFSQFVGMLHLIREKLQEREATFAYLDGSTTDRAGQVDAFQKKGDREFFLISLKAGGYGLNLTAADHVLLVDPWWNPAVEAQAIDRAHRIGQGRPVTVHRLITRGTVEEKILQLQARKRAVMDMVLEDDALVLNGVSEDELEELLR